MNRRELLALACGWNISSIRALAQHEILRPAGAAGEQAADAAGPADVTLRIAETDLDLGPGRSVRTLAYNGQVPGPLLRLREGQPVTVDVFNDSKDEDIVHWHGLHIPPDVDGAYEEGTPGVAAGGRRRYRFTPTPSGTRWYHSHNPAGRNFRKSTYTGQFGMLIVEGREDQSAYDLEVPILLHEWEARLARSGPVDVEYRTYSVNGKMLGAGDPVRVRAGQRVLFRIVNASATMPHRLALPGHLFRVVALDGNPVPAPRDVSAIDVSPGERVDAIVEMNRAGVWIFGEINDRQRSAGLGIVIEYAGGSGPPQWAPTNYPWSYVLFAGPAAAPEPDSRQTFVFRSPDGGHHWTINGKEHPRSEPIIVRANQRHRWLLDNQSAEDHPIHLHRHTFEIVRFDGRPVSGIRKDVVVVPAWKQVEIDVVADQPGLALFHCHQQFHMDMGFMTLVRYAG